MTNGLTLDLDYLGLDIHLKLRENRGQILAECRHSPPPLCREAIRNYLASVNEAMERPMAGGTLNSLKDNTFNLGRELWRYLFGSCDRPNPVGRILV
jgi:hypothetical protein